MGLLKKRDTTHPDPRVRLEAVEASTNEIELVRVACTDDWPRVRMAAVARVENDTLLARIAREAKELDVRLAAAERIASERVLADLIRESENRELMGICFSRITDKAVIQSIAEDTRYSPTARKLAVEHYADEGYLAEVSGIRREDDTGRKTPEAVKEILDAYGGGLRGVRAIGRFKRSEKALKALGTIAQGGGEEGGLAVEYLCSALGSGNEEVRTCAADELAALQDPDVVAIVVRAFDNPSLREPVRDVLTRINSPEARAALNGE
jgi:hypothetical protein